MLPARLASVSLRVGLAFGAGIVLAACSTSSDPDTPVSLVEGGGGTLTTFDADEREPVGLVEGTLLNGEEFTSADLTGDIVVYNVWGSWCPPCRKEAPALARAARENADRGVTFVGLNIRDSDDGARAFERRFEMPYQSVRSADSPFALLELSEELRASSVPATVVVDREGGLAAWVIGEITYPTLAGLIDDVAAESETRSAS